MSLEEEATSTRDTTGVNISREGKIHEKYSPRPLLDIVTYWSGYTISSTDLTERKRTKTSDFPR
jgi:hypothetical protein